MIEPDLLVSGFLQRVGDRIGLVEPREAVGQPGFVDLALMLLERRDVGVAENREAVRTKLDAPPDGIEAGGDGLMRQSVDQIEVDAGDAGPPQALGRSCGLLETLHPVDGALHDGIEALHAKARPVDAAKSRARRSSRR